MHGKFVTVSGIYTYIPVWLLLGVCSSLFLYVQTTTKVTYTSVSLVLGVQTLIASRRTVSRSSTVLI